MLVALCGIDGSGKTTQARILKEYYQNKGMGVISIRQHTKYYQEDKRMYDYLHGNLEKTNLLVAEMALFSAFDRMRQYQVEMQPRINKNEIIIADRYVYSTYAYYIMRGLDLKWVMEINKYLPLPDCTIYIDISAERAYQRISNRNDMTLEEDNRKYMEKLRSIYNDQPWGKRNSYYILDGDKNVMDVANEIIRITDSYL